jgi:hypothetical protein
MASHASVQGLDNENSVPIRLSVLVGGIGFVIQAICAFVILRRHYRKST